MSSSRAGGKLRKWTRAALLGFLLLAVSFYVLLAAGLLGEVPGTIAGALASGDSLEISFRGLRTDLFWNTSADTVRVLTDSGLEVVVAGADIGGSVTDYLLNGHVGMVTVESLFIGLPEDSGDEGGADSLVAVLESIDKGIVVSTELLLLEYGTIRDPSGVVLDSMYLRCSIDRIAGVHLQVDSAGVYLPGLGGIGGSGELSLVDGTVSTEGFNIRGIPGELRLTGSLYGAEERLSIEFSGSASTEAMDSPVDVSAVLEGTLDGRLPDLKVGLALRDGTASAFGREFEFSADTLIVSMDSIRVGQLIASTAGLSLNAGGRLALEDMSWEASVDMGMYGLDLSSVLTGAFGSSITGTLSADLHGRGTEGTGGRAVLDLTNSTVSVVSIPSLHLDASLEENDLRIEGNMAAGGGTVSLRGSSRLGPDRLPETWNLSADGTVDDLSFIRRLFHADLPEVSYAWFSLNGSGTRFGADLRGSTGIRGFRASGVRADMLSFSGEVSYAAGRGGSLPSAFGFLGEVRMTGFSTGGLEVDTAVVSGSFNSSGTSMSAQGVVSLDSLRVASQVLALQAAIEADGNRITVSDLLFTASGERQYSGDLQVSLGDTVFLDLRDLRAVHSKLRLINDGSLSVFFTDGSVVLDTLWIDPPVGRLGLSGRMGEEGLSARAEVDNLDLTSLSAIAGLPADMSGVGSFEVAYRSDTAGVHGSFTGRILSPSYGQFSMDSITIDISSSGSSLTVNGIYAWHDGVRSGLQLRANDAWTGTEVSILGDRLEWMEMEVNDIGDWLFYVLPLPVRTMGASVSARVEYRRNGNGYDLQMQASARIDRLFITILGVELPNVNFYLSYPDSSAAGYNTRFTTGSGSAETGNFSSTWRADVQSIFPFRMGEYSMRSDLTEMRIAIPGIGAVICSGELLSRGDGLDVRPMLSGKIRVLEGAVGIPQPVTASSGEGSGEMPFDLSIDVSGTGGIWFRTSFADIEMSLKLRILTLENMPTVNGTVSAVRGRITLLQRDFQITEGTVTVFQGHPPSIQLNIEAATRVRSSISQQEYEITVLIHGDAENPEVTLTGIGPAGRISQEDILTLLAAGVTYGEMQQLNSSAIRTEVENVAQSMLGNMLARNIRREIGLDTFEISPELLADTTSLVLNVGKYVLPDLYVSYKDDVFSGDPGTVSAQYFFSSDLYVEGSSRTTFHGYLEPTIELHYTIRY
ncbi:MAG: hypothetical protein AVO35_08265 [Candidatus Aegiribacteria sp. MLS_C]|nr:MAG: hypothetical protein AVO35_08265 [Candidatus Aegiribacteria sp. MLS_C]